jgi:hypothetical protein
MTNAGVIFGQAIEKVGSIFSDMDFSVLQLLMACTIRFRFRFRFVYDCGSERDLKCFSLKILFLFFKNYF